LFFTKKASRESPTGFSAGVNPLKSWSAQTNIAIPFIKILLN